MQNPAEGAEYGAQKWPRRFWHASRAFSSSIGDRNHPPARQLKLGIEEVVDVGLPRIYDKPLYEQKGSALFGHIYERYPERDAGVYASAV